MITWLIMSAHCAIRNGCMGWIRTSDVTLRYSIILVPFMMILYENGNEWTNIRGHFQTKNTRAHMHTWESMNCEYASSTWCYGRFRVTSYDIALYNGAYCTHWPGLTSRCNFMPEPTSNPPFVKNTFVREGYMKKNIVVCWRSSHFRRAAYWRQVKLLPLT